MVRSLVVLKIHPGSERVKFTLNPSYSHLIEATSRNAWSPGPLVWPDKTWVRACSTVSKICTVVSREAVAKHLGPGPENGCGCFLKGQKNAPVF